MQNMNQHRNNDPLLPYQSTLVYAYLYFLLKCFHIVNREEWFTFHVWNLEDGWRILVKYFIQYGEASKLTHFLYFLTGVQ